MQNYSTFRITLKNGKSIPILEFFKYRKNYILLLEFSRILVKNLFHFQTRLNIIMRNNNGKL